MTRRRHASPWLLLAPAVVLVPAAMASALFVRPPVVAVSLVIATDACAAWLVWGARAVARSARDEPGDAAAPDDPVAEPPPQPRDIFDGDASVYAAWYFALRLHEEMERASRAGATLCVLKITSRSAGAFDAGRVAARQWLGESGFAGRVGQSVTLVLTEGGRAAGDELARRVTSHVRGVRVEVTEFPADGTTFRALLGEDGPAGGNAAA